LSPSHLPSLGDSCWLPPPCSALNFAGSVGDCVEAYVVSRQQPDALVQDDGDKVHVFVPHG
jgi:hypothetical protein